MTTALHAIAPGSRIVVRDEEWLVRRVDQTSSGTRMFSVVGLSNLVRDREAMLLEDLEDDLQIVDPTKAEPVLDETSFYRGARLHIEALLRDTAPPGNHIPLGHRGVMDLVPYQLDPAFQALEQPRQRILIADAVGLGKTIECGILLIELGRGRRILVLTVKSMMTQCQKELWSRFTIPLTRLDSYGLKRVRSKIPTNHNPFHYYDRSIISIDTIKRDGEYRTHLENAWWDVMVIDEAHKVADRGTGSQRRQVADPLSNRSDSLILLFRTSLEKALFSSPAACIATLDERVKRMESRSGPERFRSDIESLTAFRSVVARIEIADFSKYQALVGLFRVGSLGWTGKKNSERVVVFTERIATLRFLQENLRKDLNLKANQIEILHGAMSDKDQQEIVEAFGSGDSPVQILIASDVASEGINLHYQCRHLLHFDIPWSLLVFQQRNGRIDRYGQTRTPHIHYLLTQSGDAKIRGDQRILELLVEKGDQFRKITSRFTGFCKASEEKPTLVPAEFIVPKQKPCRRTPTKRNFAQC